MTSISRIFLVVNRCHYTSSILSIQVYSSKRNSTNMVVSMDRWEGAVAVVTGASAGVGAAICESLVAAGLKVVGLSRHKEKVTELARKLKGKPGELCPIKCDMNIESEIIKAFDWVRQTLGPISILVNHAAIFKKVNLTSSPTQDFKDIWDTNVLGLTIATREAAKSMIDNKIEGHIIHISGVAGYKVVTSTSGAYSASKFAVRALGEALRQELNEVYSNCKVTTISPGLVDTDVLRNAVSNVDELPRLRPEDIADAVIYALSTPPKVQVHELVIKPVGEKF